MRLLHDLHLTFQPSLLTQSRKGNSFNWQRRDFFSITQACGSVMLNEFQIAAVLALSLRDGCLALHLSIAFYCPLPKDDSVLLASASERGEEARQEDRKQAMFPIMLRVNVLPLYHCMYCVTRLTMVQKLVLCLLTYYRPETCLLLQTKWLSQKTGVL